MTLARWSLLIAIVAAATIAGAWVFQLAGYAPCELCLKERIPYYTAAPLAFVAFLLATRHKVIAARALLALVALIFAGGTVLAIYHSGVEFGWWPGPSDCTGDFAAAASTQDFLKQLQTVQVVRCDAVAIRVLGLSLAAWNVVISAVLAIVAAIATLRR